MQRSVRTWMCIGVATILSGADPARGTPVDINGGSSWTGWTSRGLSNERGTWSKGSTTLVYELYTTVFTFDASVHVVAPSALSTTNGPGNFNRGTFTTYNRNSTSVANPTSRPVTMDTNNPAAIGGAFDDGNLIYGIGVRIVDNAQFENIDTTTADPAQRRAYRWAGGSGTYAPGGAFRPVSFGLNDAGNTSFSPASTVGGTDGRISFSQFSRHRDFTISLFPIDFSSQEITIQDTSGTFWGGTNSTLYIPGGYGSGVSYDYPFRAFGADVDGVVHAWQLFIDLTALQKLYGPDDSSEDSILDHGCCALNRAAEAGVGVVDLSKLTLMVGGWANSYVVINALPQEAYVKPKVFQWQAAKPE